MWETLEKADTGCTPGGGINNMAIFFDAGLMFQTDTAGGTPIREGNSFFQDIKADCLPNTIHISSELSKSGRSKKLQQQKVVGMGLIAIKPYFFCNITSSNDSWRG